MAISIFDLFKIGIGPSSSHTVGPMRAAARFIERLEQNKLLAEVTHIRVELFGSLAHTGRGHGSDKAVMLGLEGEQPDQIDPDNIPKQIDTIKTTGKLNLGGIQRIGFNPDSDLIFNKKDCLPYHPNGMRFIALGADDRQIASREYYSVGGGFVVNEDTAAKDRIVRDKSTLPLHFQNGDQLLKICNEQGKSISEIMLINETHWQEEAAVLNGINKLWRAMVDCVQRGYRQEGVLPGGFKVKRRAPELFRELTNKPESSLKDPLTILDWINLYALAVNEENAAGGRVVTAPTNGAAGILPAVGLYYERFCSHACEQGIINFLLTAAAIGFLYKENASISGAEVGCQGEVGVACSMAAGGLVGALGGTPEQVENAAEIGMEHNLGLTCDPIGGLVQIPCIERNAMGAVKALNAARMAMRGDGKHHVSLDKVIATMRETGADMQTKYKETSRGGLAVNVIEC